MQGPGTLGTLTQGGGGGGRGGRRGGRGGGGQGGPAIGSLQCEGEVVAFPCVSGVLELGGAIRDRRDEGGRGSGPCCGGAERVRSNRWFSGGRVGKVRAVTAS